MGVANSKKNLFSHELTVNNRNYILLYVGGDHYFRKIHLLPRSFSLYNTLDTHTFIFRHDIENVIMSSEIGDVILLYSTYDDIDLLSKIQDGAELSPRQIVHIIETAKTQGYVIKNVTSCINDRDIEVLSSYEDNNDLLDSSLYVDKEETWPTISMSIEKMKVE
jgi:hypothetical protein